jgi:hypothetical protein
MSSTPDEVARETPRAPRTPRASTSTYSAPMLQSSTTPPPVATCARSASRRGAAATVIAARPSSNDTRRNARTSRAVIAPALFVRHEPAAGRTRSLHLRARAAAPRKWRA